MPVPDFQAVMLPLLDSLADGRTRSVKELAEALAQHFSLTAEERRQLLPSGRQSTFDNRLHWAVTYLVKAGVLERPQRGHVHITDRGLQVLQQRPSAVNIPFLEQFDEFTTFRTHRRTKGPEAEYERTPEEVLEEGYTRLRQALAQGLLGGHRDQLRGRPVVQHRD